MEETPLFLRNDNLSDGRAEVSPKDMVSFSLLVPKAEPSFINNHKGQGDSLVCYYA